MNYRHAYHAGNFADVVKHVILTRLVEYLKRKEQAFRVIDTHAGIGLYDLKGIEAGKTGEWTGGIGRLLGPDADPLPAAISDLLAPYLDVVRTSNPAGALNVYPGSPSLALALLRPEDRLVASELHPEDIELLRQSLRGDRRAKILALDGWQAIRALLPPRERRGLILIDPPFEEAGELDRLLTGLTDGLRRFATGTYMLWLPIKDQRPITDFERALKRLSLDKLLWIELRIAPIAPDTPLAATAIVMVNPPYGLTEDLSELLPFLTDRLAIASSGGWAIRKI